MPVSFKERFAQIGIDTDAWTTRRVFFAAGVHELCGVGLLVGMWVLCYKIKVTSEVLKFAPKTLQKNFAQGEAWSRRKLACYPTITRRVTDPHRLVMSGAESFVIRKVISPVTVPCKLIIAGFVSAVLPK